MTFVGHGTLLDVMGQTIAVSLRRWNSRSVSTTAGRTPPCSRPRVGVRSTHTRSPAWRTDESSTVVVIDDLSSYVRSPVDEFRPVFRPEPIHFGDQFFQAIVLEGDRPPNPQFSPVYKDINFGARL